MELITGGEYLNTEGEPGMKKMNVGSNSVGLADIMSGSIRNNVVPLRPGLGTPPGYENWLSKIEDGKAFACRRRDSFVLNVVFWEVYQKLSSTGKGTFLTEYRDGEDIFRPVDTLAFSQMFEWMENVDVKVMRSEPKRKESGKETRISRTRTTIFR
jgi:hypothetical protein